METKKNVRKVLLVSKPFMQTKPAVSFHFDSFCTSQFVDFGVSSKFTACKDSRWHENFNLCPHEESELPPAIWTLALVSKMYAQKI